MDFNSAGSVEVMIGSGRYSNKRLLSTSVLVSKVTFSLYIPKSSALVCIQVMFPRTDNAFYSRNDMFSTYFIIFTIISF